MQQKIYSFQNSIAERIRKKSPTLDMRVPRSFSPKQVTFPVESSFRSVPLRGKGVDGVQKKKDSLFVTLKEQPLKVSLIRMLRLGQIYLRRSRRMLYRIVPDVSETTPRRMVYGSIAGGVAFGMVSMVFLTHIFGSGVSALGEAPPIVTTAVDVSEDDPQVKGEMTTYDPEKDLFFEYFNQKTKEQYEENIRSMVKGYPIEAMLPYIFEQDRMTAAFLIGIAKKESNWGKRVPVLDDQDCFNYWGYRGIRRMMGSGGHTCFNSRKDAVETVATRLEKLIHSEKLDTPEKMIVWKCGFSCEGHSRESVRKWISDVDMYFSQLEEE